MSRALVALAALATLSACKGREPAPTPRVPGSLAAHTAEFARQVYRVTDGVSVAVGFGLANSILIEGDDGVIIVDTMESADAAAAVKAEFDRLTQKPVRAIIYTHNHTDHVSGTTAFVSGPMPPVYAHETTAHLIDQVVGPLRPVVYRRSMRMFGNYLSPDEAVNAGIGPFLRAGHGGGAPGIVRPTETVAEERELRVAGVTLRLVHAPGETSDQLFVWLPEKRVLLPGDNFYRAFPNLYTIRGTPNRDVTGWVQSLDRMRALRPAYLVPSHTRPLAGEDEIAAALTDYRDAIQYVHDQTVRGMNAGLGPDELVETIHLPPHLAASPYLQEHYGTVAWGVRAVFAGYLGWFDGDALGLAPLGPQARAQRLAALAGGNAALLAAARQALAAGDWQWAAELADACARADPHAAGARDLEAQALEQLGLEHPSANGRHYYLTQARELEGRVQIAEDLAGVPLAQIDATPLATFMRTMPVHLAAERCLDLDRVVGFRFPDAGEAWTVHVRRGVAEVAPRFPDHPDVAVTVDAAVWKEIAAGRRSAAVALASGAVAVEGGTLDLIAFLRLFEPS